MHARELAVEGVRLALLESGPPDAPPLVLLHGWSQSADVWASQLEGELAGSYRVVAVDLRGHGRSSVPEDGYGDSGAWAGDLRAVLADLGRPAVLVGWSYGGLVIYDYLRTHGDDLVAGVVLVGAITEIGRGRRGGRIGPVMRAAIPDAYSEDIDVALPALLAFVRDMVCRPVGGRWTQLLAANALRVPPRVRAGLFDRSVDSTELLTGSTLPTLVLHGRQDPVVDVSAAEYAASLLPRARTHLMDGVGHLPFVEVAEEFDAVVGEFARACFGGGRAAEAVGREGRQ